LLKERILNNKSYTIFDLINDKSLNDHLIKKIFSSVSFFFLFSFVATWLIFFRTIITILSLIFLIFFLIKILKFIFSNDYIPIKLYKKDFELFDKMN
jgi:hypothetical protein